ncbi:MAG: insulinase family protein [Cyclobacteriaceae bacterium]|nr:insulinase family protein [Cyclobacteriaceae bacterium]MCH8516794.1 insulinase family protein [Cyclobacteriaceae bacterium]
MSREIQTYTFENGIRVVHQYNPYSAIAHCGFVLDIGSRDESDDQVGLAHFWEHMAFKGTKRRKAYHILSRIDKFGGELNAYTTKEKITFHASVLREHLDKALDILTDITFHSVFPEKQLELEKSVILEEMSMYKDSPEDAILDEFDELIFKQHPLGKNILGSEESVKSFTRTDFERFLAENMDTSKIVFSCVGNISFSRLIKKLEKYLSLIPQKKRITERLPFKHYEPDYRVVKKPILQSQCAFGTTAYSLHDERRLPLYLMLNLLGGPGMNSRLNLSLREKYGYVYGVEASLSTYIDTGLAAIFFGTMPGYVPKSMRVVKREIDRFKQKKMTPTQLIAAKEQLIGQMAMSEENNLANMIGLGRQLLDHDRLISFQEVADKVRSITADQVQDVSIDTFDDSKISTLIYEATADQS